jgi:hypothetical protein
MICNFTLPLTVMQTPQHSYSSGPLRETIPNSGAVLILGILSVLFCWFYGFLSLILGITALVLAANGAKEYNREPGRYDQASYYKLRLGRNFAIAGLCLGALSLIFALLWMMLFGAVFFNIFDLGL